MIDYNKLFAFRSIVNNTKAIKTFSNKNSLALYDKRLRTTFSKFLSAPRPVRKFFVTDSTMKRIEVMDLSHCPCSSLKSLFDKYDNEVGFVFCNKDKIHFIYSITNNFISLICFKGEKEPLVYRDPTKRYQNNNIEDYSYMDKAIIGSCIMPYSDNNPIMLPNCASGRIRSRIDGDSAFAVNREFLLEVKKYKKEVESIEKKGISIDKGTEISLDKLKKLSPYLYAENINYRSKLNDIWLCIRMFVFLKTAKVIDETFIAENGNAKQYIENGRKNQGVIVVDSFYDSTINVINPFSVSGHFRNQPKKNDKGEWYKELIYIDSYIKNGYTRKAKILEQ